MRFSSKEEKPLGREKWNEELCKDREKNEAQREGEGGKKSQFVG